MPGFLLNIRQIDSKKKIIIGLSLAILLISLTQPSFYISRIDYDAWSNSFILFLFGWSFVIGGSVESLIWWANPIYVLALVLFIKNNKLSIPLSFLAVLTALSFSQLHSVVTSESGETSKITSLELGYKLWVASFVVLFVGTIINEIARFLKR